MMEKELTPKQQTSEAIRQADSILVLTGQHPSVDQVASTIALAAILRKFGKKVSAVISDEIPAGAKFLPTRTVDTELGGMRDFIMKVDLAKAEVDRLKYTVDNGKLNVILTPFSGSFRPADVSFDYGEFDYDLVIVLGVASYARIDKLFGQNAGTLRNAPLVNIDFHRSNEQYGAINLIEPSAASLGEILVALSESLQTGLIDSEIATTVLAGILAATDRFTATHTTAKAMTVAAQMMAAGGDHQAVIRGLYKGGSGDKDKRGDRPQQQPPRKEKGRDQKPERDNRPSIQVTEQAVAPTQKPAAPMLIEPEATPAPEPATAPEPNSVPDFTPAPESKPSPELAEAVTKPSQPQAQPVATAPEKPRNELWETDAPAVTDPDVPHLVPYDASDNPDYQADVEPLINGEPSPRPQAPQPGKNPNPTNNPVFADRLL